MILLAFFCLVFFVIKTYLACQAGISPEEALIWLNSINADIKNIHHLVLNINELFISNLIPEKVINNNPLFFKQLSVRLIPNFLSMVMAPLFIGKTIEWVQKKPIQKRQIFCLITHPYFLTLNQFIHPHSINIFLLSLFFLTLARLLRTRSDSSFPGDNTDFRYKLTTIAAICVSLLFISTPWAIIPSVIFIISGAGVVNTILFTCLISSCVYAAANLWSTSNYLFQYVNESLFTSVFLTHSSFDFIFEKSKYILIIIGPALVTYCLFFTIKNIRKFFTNQKKTKLIGTQILWISLFCLSIFLAPLKTLSLELIIACAIPVLILVISQCYKKRITPIIIILAQLLICLGIFGLFTPFGSNIKKHSILSSNQFLKNKLHNATTLNNYIGWDQWSSEINLLKQNFSADSVSFNDRKLLAVYKFFSKEEISLNPMKTILVSKKRDIDNKNCRLTNRKITKPKNNVDSWYVFICNM